MNIVYGRDFANGGAPCVHKTAEADGEVIRGGADIDVLSSGGFDDVVHLAGAGNDVLRGLPPEAARENLDGILEAASARALPVLLVGIGAWLCRSPVPTWWPASAGVWIAAQLFVGAALVPLWWRLAFQGDQRTG